MTDAERAMQNRLRSAKVVGDLAWLLADLTVRPSDRTAETQRIIADAYAKYDEEASGDE